MGYLANNKTPRRFYVECEEIYPLRVIVVPGFASDADLRTLVKDVVPDPEDWQFSGRRYRVKPRYGRKTKGIHPAAYAQNSRRIRDFDQEVVFAFHSTIHRDAVTARLSNNGFTYRIEDDSDSFNELVIVVP
jgi:hypothetical protein